MYEIAVTLPSRVVERYAWVQRRSRSYQDVCVNRRARPAGVRFVCCSLQPIMSRDNHLLVPAARLSIYSDKHCCEAPADRALDVGSCDLAALRRMFF